MVLPIARIDVCVRNGVAAMYHHAAAHINTDVRNAGGVVSPFEKDKVAGFCLCARYGGADVVKSLRPKPPNVPPGMIDYPRHIAGTVKGR